MKSFIAAKNQSYHMIKLENIFLPSWESYLECNRIQNNKLKLAKKKRERETQNSEMAKEDEDGQAKFDDDSHMLADGCCWFFFERCKTCTELLLESSGWAGNTFFLFLFVARTYMKTLNKQKPNP